MRVTPPCLRMSLRWASKDMWKRRGFVRSTPAMLTAFTKDKPIVDPNIEMMHREPLVWENPLLKDPRYAPKQSSEDHADYQDQPVYEFHKSSRLMEGLTQACILSKTEPHFELPQRILESVGRVELPYQDELVQRAIMQANVWDPTKDKLPKRFNKRLPGWHYKAESGIPISKQRALLLDNLVRLCQMRAGDNIDLLTSTSLLQHPAFAVHYTIPDGIPIYIEGRHHAALLAGSPLTPFSTAEEVSQTADTELPTIFPLAPTIDLRKQHVYTPHLNITGVKPGFEHPHPHTLFMSLSARPQRYQQNASVLMFTFGQALAAARQLYGPTVGALPEPVTTQCVATDGTNFILCCFQLNTADFSSLDGVKNQVWLDTENLLYKKIVPERAMLRNTKYEDYDPTVFQKILALYFNGANMENVSQS